MNVTVVVPNTLRLALDGRRRVELGVPTASDVGDVLQALFALYPKLAKHVPSEKRPVRQHLNIVLSAHATKDVPKLRERVKEGQTLYLFASGSPPQHGPVKGNPTPAGGGGNRA